MTIWLYPSPLILASASLTRRAMLHDIGIPLDVVKADLDERALDEGLRAQSAPPHAIACALAEAKAKDISRHHQGRLVLGADQILDCDERIIDKANNRAEAEEKLAFLSGRTHRLTSAAALICDDRVILSVVSEAYLTMRPLSSASIKIYADAAGDALTQSVGAYEIERLGALLFAKIEGDHFTIRGLPLLALVAGFRQQGWLAL